MKLQHSNEQAYNWLVYKNANRSIEKYTKYLRGRLYDLGCGAKAFEPIFHDHIDTYVGVDRANTEQESKTDIVADFNKPLPIEDEAADTVMAISLMVELYEPQTFVNESYRILKKDGYMIVEVPFQWWVHKSPHDYYRYTPYGLKYLFGKAGFSEIKIETAGGFFTMWFLKMNYFSRRLIRGPKALQWLIKACLTPFWYLGQIIAPYLDRLDNHPELETQAFWVIAKK